jgi:hypothetical protein
MYPTTVIPGGTSVTYSANQIFVITKAQEKAADGNLDGWKFTINIFKSRFVKEKAKLPFTVLYEKGIQKTSGLLDIALESGHIIKPSMGWYQRVNMETGEIDAKKFRAKETDNAEFWSDILKSESFNNFIENNRYNTIYTLSAGIINTRDITLEEENYVKLSEFALKTAKDNGRNNYYIYSKTDYDSYKRKLYISKALHNAVNEDFKGFQVFYP